MATLKFNLLKFIVLLLASYAFHILGCSMVTGTLIGILIVSIPRPKTKVEQRKNLVLAVSGEFRSICQGIVDSQYRPTSKFDQHDLKGALGIKRLPKPEYVEKFESENVYTFPIKKNFIMKVSIVTGIMNTGGSASCQEYGFSGYEFGGCNLFEGEMECAKFNYKARFIDWLTEEFEDITGFIDQAERLENHLDKEERQFTAMLKEA